MRWLLRVCVILVAVGVIVIGGLLLLPGEHLARLAADQVKAQTGRDLTVDGDVRLSFWPVLGVETGPVSFANAEWAGDAPMLTASGLSIGVAAPDLLRGEIRIKRIDASDPVLRLESRGGKSNWTFDAAVTDATTTSTTPEQASSSTGAGQGDTLPPLVLEQLRLRNARMVLVQDGTVSLDQAGVDVTARWPGPDRPVEADLTVPLSADPIQVQISLGNLAGFVDGEVSAVTAKVKTAGGVLSFDGKANSSGDASGALLLEASNSRQFMASLGQPGIDLPHGLGRALKLDGQVTYTADGRVSIRQLQLVADGNSLSGDVDVTMSDKPKFTAHLNAQTLDLSALSEAASDPVSPSPGSSASADAEAGWSTAAIDASALGLADGTLSLSAASVILPQTTLGKTRIGLTIDRSRAVLRMEPVSIFGGTLTGQLVANNRNGLSVGGNLKASGIELNSALPALAEIDTLHGPVSGNLEFLGVGQSEDQIMRSLSGKGNVDIGKGFFTGFDLEGLMRSGQGNGGSTVFDNISASFTMDGGNLRNSDLLMVVKGYNVTGDGRIGLGAQDMDYNFYPHATHKGRALRIPVRVSGPWTALKIRPDLGKAVEDELKAKLEAEKDKLKNDARSKAEEAVREKLSEELDTTITDDQDIEETIKDALENEAKKGLLKLLGSN